MNALPLRSAEQGISLMTKTSDFTAYPTFSDDANVSRRAYNRVVTARNIFEAHGTVVCEKYLNQFPENEKQEFMIMSVAIKSQGLEEVKRKIFVQEV
jgi:hypothetical protein